MTEQTLNALKLSIEHWERLASGTSYTDESIGSVWCDLCKLYFHGGCRGCPVAEKAKSVGCQNTPYDNIQDLLRNFGLDSQEFRDAAKEELKFLKSLLPPADPSKVGTPLA